MIMEEGFRETYNPCDECDYSYSKNNQEMGMCKICEFKELLQEPERKWIPVSERLPEEPNYYEVTIEYDNKQRTETSYYSTKEGRWSTYTNYVTAWRERLPEPYKAGE